ncbi:unnamed protein product, partial [Brassica oleracea var. botrytis]
MASLHLNDEGLCSRLQFHSSSSSSNSPVDESKNQLPDILCVVQSAVTGEHTCMLLKPLNKDEFEVSESNELGFFGPFYTG